MGLRRERRGIGMDFESGELLFWNLKSEKKGTSLGEFQGTRRERKREEINMLSQILRVRSK